MGLIPPRIIPPISVSLSDETPIYTIGKSEPTGYIDKRNQRMWLVTDNTPPQYEDALVTYETCGSGQVLEYAKPADTQDSPNQEVFDQWNLALLQRMNDRHMEEVERRMRDKAEAHNRLMLRLLWAVLMAISAVMVVVFVHLLK